MPHCEIQYPILRNNNQLAPSIFLHHETPFWILEAPRPTSDARNHPARIPSVMGRSSAASGLCSCCMSAVIAGHVRACLRFQRRAAACKHNEKNNNSRGKKAFFSWRWVFSPVASVVLVEKQFSAGD
jgi:hypothetical protein